MLSSNATSFNHSLKVLHFHDDAVDNPCHNSNAVTVAEALLSATMLIYSSYVIITGAPIAINSRLWTCEAVKDWRTCASAR